MIYIEYRSSSCTRRRRKKTTQTQGYFSYHRIDIHILLALSLGNLRDVTRLTHKNSTRINREFSASPRQLGLPEATTSSATSHNKRTRTAHHCRHSLFCPLAPSRICIDTHILGKFGPLKYTYFSVSLLLFIIFCT